MDSGVAWKLHRLRPGILNIQIHLDTKTMADHQHGTLAPNTDNIKLTKGCKKVLEYLERFDELCSAQDIYGLMRADDTKCPGLTTVYRSLESLVSQGLVQEVVLGDGERRYEMVHPGEHHHHLVCEKCRKSVHLDECLVEQIEENIRTKHGFRIKSHLLELFGVCQDCDKPQTKSTAGVH
jgi:Fur family ferric uptake transcriptional regulator